MFSIDFLLQQNQVNPVAIFWRYGRPTLEPDVSKQPLVRVSLSKWFHGNHFHQSGVHLLGGHTPTTWKRERESFKHFKQTMSGRADTAHFSRGTWLVYNFSNRENNIVEKTLKLAKKNVYISEILGTSRLQLRGGGGVRISSIPTCSQWLMLN